MDSNWSSDMHRSLKNLSNYFDVGVCVFPESDGVATAVAPLSAPAQQSAGRSVWGRVGIQSSSPLDLYRAPDKQYSASGKLNLCLPNRHRGEQSGMPRRSQCCVAFAWPQCLW